VTGKQLQLQHARKILSLLLLSHFLYHHPLVAILLLDPPMPFHHNLLLLDPQMLFHLIQVLERLYVPYGNS
jgi:hypothetical protein